MTWRMGLFIGVMGVTTGGWVWMWWSASSLRGSLSLLLAVFALGMAGVFWVQRKRLTPRLVTANLALGSIVHTGLAALVVGGDRLWQLGLVPALASNWHHFLIGCVGIVAALLTWIGARRSGQAAPVRTVRADQASEPAPPATPELIRAPDWKRLVADLVDREDGVRLRHLQALQRIGTVLDREGPNAARRVLHQEALRIVADSAADARDSDEDDVLSQAAVLFAWGAQKLPELGELDVSDLLMAKAIADIRASHSAVEHVFVDHRELWAIHPITRATAHDKCDERAAAARNALPILRTNGMRLSEDLIAAHPELHAFESVTGFQVVEVDGHYVTFEGNGRREALQRAFGDDEGVQIEVRLYTFDDPEVEATIQRRVRRVRRWKGVGD